MTLLSRHRVSTRWGGGFIFEVQNWRACTHKMNIVNLDTQTLSVEERLSLIAQRCESLEEQDATADQPTPAQWAEIERRLRLLDKDPQRTIAWEEILQRIQARQTYMRLEFTPEAGEDIEEAFFWYESREEGLSNLEPVLSGQTQLARRAALAFHSSPNSRVRYDNITFSTPDPAQTEYVYNTANELLRTYEDGDLTRYTYDAWGRTLSKYKGSGATVHAEYEYGYGDKLTKFTSTFEGEAGRVDYLYDGLGKRRSKLVNQTDRTWFRWEGWNELGAYAEGTDPNSDWDIGTLERYYVPGLASHAGSDPATGGVWHFQLNDHLGSPRTLLGQSKQVLARYAYTPFGNTALAAGLPMDIGYTGHTREPEIGQYFAPFRYYSPGNARWLTRDPLGFVDGPNVYGYLPGVNPVGYVDLRGEMAYAAPCVALGPVGWVALGVLGTGTIIYVWSKHVPRQQGGSGKPRRHFDDVRPKKDAHDKAQDHGGGRKPIEHKPHKPGQPPHFHPSGPDGKPYPDGSHYPFKPALIPPQTCEMDSPSNGEHEG